MGPTVEVGLSCGEDKGIAMAGTPWRREGREEAPARQDPRQAGPGTPVHLLRGPKGELLAAAAAKEQVLENPLLRGKILFYKLDLERKTRTDEDIDEAVRRWLKDPNAAERRYGHISEWDVSRVTDMSELFMGEYKQEGQETHLRWEDSSFNEDLSRWQTGNVTNMSWMFSGARSFNRDLSKWQTGKVRDMEGMFWGASSFNSDLSKWDTGSVTIMGGMFYLASSFNSDLSGWETGSVTNMDRMFTSATALKERPHWYTSWDERLNQVPKDTRVPFV